MSLSIELRPGDAKTLRLALVGSLDALTASELERRYNGEAGGSFATLVLDMAQLNYISSAGLRVVFRIAKRCKENAQRLLIANRQPQVTKVFDIVKALPDVRVFANDSELDEYLARIQQQVLDGDL